MSIRCGSLFVIVLLTIAPVAFAQQSSPGFLVSVYRTLETNPYRANKQQFIAAFPWSGEELTLSEHKSHGDYLSSVPSATQYQLDGYVTVDYKAPTSFSIQVRMPVLGYYCRRGNCWNNYFRRAPRGVRDSFMQEYNYNWNLGGGRHANPEYDRLPREPQVIDVVERADIQCTVELFVGDSKDPLINHTFGTVYAKRYYPDIFPYRQPTDQICGYVDNVTAAVKLKNGVHAVKYYLRCAGQRQFRNPQDRLVDKPYYNFCNERQETGLDTWPGDEAKFYLKMTQNGSHLPKIIKPFHQR